MITWRELRKQLITTREDEAMIAACRAELGKWISLAQEETRGSDGMTADDQEPLPLDTRRLAPHELAGLTDEELKQQLLKTQERVDGLTDRRAALMARVTGMRNRLANAEATLTEMTRMIHDVEREVLLLAQEERLRELGLEVKVLRSEIAALRQGRRA